MEPDKVGYSMTLKVGLPNYGSADVQVSYTSSLKDGETAEQAHERVRAFVEAKLAEGKNKLQNLTNNGESVSAQQVQAPAPSGAGATPPGFPGAEAAPATPGGTEAAPPGFPAPAFPNSQTGNAPTTPQPTTGGVPAGFPGTTVVSQQPTAAPSPQQAPPQNDLAQLQQAVQNTPAAPTVSGPATQPTQTPIAATENDSAIAAIQAKYGINTQQAAPTNVAALKR